MGKKTSLYDIHCNSGGLMVTFAGWDLPLHYGSQMEEHNRVRNDAGIFDVSHMRVIDIEGIAANKFLSYLLANDINKLNTKDTALYGCMLNESGGILDDLITYFLEPNKYRLVVNAATYSKDLSWIQNVSKTFKVTILAREELAIIAIQGPYARAKVAHILKNHPIELGRKNAAKNEKITQSILNLKRFHCVSIDNWLIARTGYTGEDGIEIMLPNAEVISLWHTLTSNGIKPAGLGARDTLRLEAGLNLYGTDMDERYTPLASNLAWTVAFDPHDRKFIGREALELQKNKDDYPILVGIVLQDKGVLRGGQKLYVHGAEVGVITSGTFSPSLKQSIAFARVNNRSETEYWVDIRGKRLKVKKTELPFFKK